MPDPAAPADDPVHAVAAAVLGHRGVVRLDGGPYGTVASYLPGRRRVLGVQVGAGSAHVGVVVRPGVALPRLSDEIGALVRDVLGPVAVEVTFFDIAEDAPTVPPPRRGPHGGAGHAAGGWGRHAGLA
ncbi:hypothetical protein ACFQE5_21550 [Pseudonocardia hispaniensis]|uniref:Alkaline shock family protein YloU n=1 Tax=Pseudonocardia hispaniensis TaxID=904933 RepID=A0ABW1J7Z2_9PSEU